MKSHWNSTQGKTEKKRRLRKRNVTWFNPPFDVRVKTSFGKEFFRIINECFLKGHALKPIFNPSTLKLSYSCMPNVKSVIDTKNKRLLLQSGAETREKRLCNCRKKKECPLDNQCLAKGIVYQASVTSSKGTEHYVGLTDMDFNARFANHKQSFTTEKYSNQTELSKYVWRLKKAKTEYKITWKILGRARRIVTLQKDVTYAHLKNIT